MNNKEYQQIFLEWQNFLNNSVEENNVLSEAVILENLILHEGLKQISAKFGREGLLYLASLAIPALLPSHVQAENLEGNIPRHQIATIKKLSQDPGVIASLEQALNSKRNSVGEEIGDPQAILNFRRGLDEKVFTEERMDVSLLSGVFVKETYKDGFQNKEAIQKIVKKVKKIISSNSSDRSFYIKVNNKKYIVIVDADSSTSLRAINNASSQISHSIVRDVIGRFKTSNKEIKQAAKQCKLELTDRIERHVKSSFNNLRDGSYGSFMSVNQFFEIFYKCFNFEYDLVEKGSKDFEILSPAESLHGIITIDTPLIKSLTDGKLASTLKHEIGHLLSSQADSDGVIDTKTLEMFYKYLENESIGGSPDSFSLSDIAKFIFVQHCKKHGVNLTENALNFLENKTKRILLKMSKKFANQLLSSNSIEIKNKKLSFIVDYNFYYSNLEERVENLKSWMLSINSDQKAEKAESFLKSFYSYLSDGDYENDVEEYLKDSTEKEFNHWQAERVIKDFIKTLIEKDSESFSDSDLYRFNMLLNFQGYSTSKQEGHKRLKSSVKNLLTLFENHIEHSH